jgi:hypothetical protein
MYCLTFTTTKRGAVMVGPSILRPLGTAKDESDSHHLLSLRLYILAEGYCFSLRFAFYLRYYTSFRL